MNKKKDFDCVQMKWDIQQRLLQEEQALGTREAERRREERLRKDPVLSDLIHAKAIAIPEEDGKPSVVSSLEPELS